MAITDIAQHANVTDSIKLRTTKLLVRSWSLLLLHNTVRDVLWAGGTRVGNALQRSSGTVFMLYVYTYARCACLASVSCLPSGSHYSEER